MNAPSDEAGLILDEIAVWRGRDCGVIDGIRLGCLLDDAAAEGVPYAVMADVVRHCIDTHRPTTTAYAATRYVIESARGCAQDGRRPGESAEAAQRRKAWDALGGLIDEARRKEWDCRGGLDR